MSYTKHYNLPEMPTGAVEWPALFNDVVDKLEAGRTILLTAGETLTVRTPFYLDDDEKAYKATNETEVHGIWQSASTIADAQGFGQINGVMTYGSWAWTPGGFIYASAGNTLTQSKPSDDARPIAFALSATEIVILISILPVSFETLLTKIYDTVQTTDETETTLVSKTLSEGKAYMLVAQVVGNEADENRGSYIRRACVFRPTGGAATLQGLVQDDFTVESVPLDWLAKDSDRTWRRVAMSSDGHYQVAIVASGDVYVSSDYGFTWTAKSNTGPWVDVAMSADGSRITVVGYLTQISVSTDYGANWSSKDSTRNWYGVDMSDSGEHQTAVVNGGQIYVSSDYGVTWTAKDSNRNWVAVAVSNTTGQYQTAVGNGTQIYISSDYGANWTAKDTNREWIKVAISSDGSKQTAIVFNGQIYVSSDYGVTWTAKDTNRAWYGIAISSTGQYQTAIVTSGQIYLSNDYGATWVSSQPSRAWSGVAMCDDASKQTATVAGDKIYISTDIAYESPWDCTIDVSGNDVRVRVTGMPDATIEWKGSLEFIEA